MTWLIISYSESLPMSYTVIDCIQVHRSGGILATSCQWDYICYSSQQLPNLSNLYSLSWLLHTCIVYTIPSILICILVQYGQLFTFHYVRSYVPDKNGFTRFYNQFCTCDLVFGLSLSQLVLSYLVHAIMGVSGIYSILF